MAIESGPLYNPLSETKPISDEAKADLQKFYEEHREWIENADLLSQPMRAIAEFVKKEVGVE